MAVYAIGDIQGCFSEFCRLLDRIKFSSDKDRLILLGDLVNRGRESLQVVRFAMDHASCVDVLLGNHDLHLLAALENVSQRKGMDTFLDILYAPDRDEIKEWISSRPLIIHDVKLNFLAVHAGIHPHWSLSESLAYAKEVEDLLRGEKRVKLLQRLYGNEPSRWSESLKKWKRARFIVNVLTRMRFIGIDRRLDFKEVGDRGTQPNNLIPWFDYPDRINIKPIIVFGHWSSLGVYRGSGILALDSGCCWGRNLSAARLDSNELEITQIRCKN